MKTFRQNKLKTLHTQCYYNRLFLLFENKTKKIETKQKYKSGIIARKRKRIR